MQVRKGRVVGESPQDEIVLRYMDRRIVKLRGGHSFLDEQVKGLSTAVAKKDLDVDDALGRLTS
ncbi:MAG TPA: hypothetical protein PKD12_12390 [Nitrospira sp.]|nr:hypothetical protein [Nitrospira sp.]